jgi:hypothetical protein
MSQYDDPYFQPPADITGAEARAYEERIVSMLREHMLPGKWASAQAAVN